MQRRTRVVARLAAVALVSCSAGFGRVALASFALRGPIADSIDYAVPGSVPLHKQAKTMSCWAASVSMLVSWKSGDISEGDFVDTLPEPLKLVWDTNAGLLPDDQAALLVAAHLRAEAPQSFSVKGWHDLLKTNGPLFVAVALQGPDKRWYGHGLVVTGIHGDGTANGTSFRIIDPAQGLALDVTVAAFVKAIEDLARSDYGNGADVRPLVMHF